MKYETFKSAVLERLQYDIPDPKRISIETIYKNNGKLLDGLVIMENGCNISPTLYLNYYFHSYESGEPFQSVYNEILHNYEENKPYGSIDIEFFTKLENIQDRIVYKLINHQKNTELLENIPHIRFMDMEMVFYCLITMEEMDGSATILIHNAHLDYWDLTMEELYLLARKNSQKLLPATIHGMTEMLREMGGEDLPEFMDDPMENMYVLTNQRNLFGAVCLLYDGCLKLFADKIQSDLIILPSSIHEAILIPCDNSDELDSFSKMVADVNETQITPWEVLSDHAYYYNRREDRIIM